MLTKKRPLGFVAFLAVSTAFMFDLAAPFFTPQVSAQSRDAYRYRILAQSNDARKAEADRLLQQGIEQFQISQFDAALQSFQEALDIYQAIKDRQGEGKSLGNLGNAYNMMGDYPKAIEYYERSLKIFQETKDREEKSIALGNLGLAYNMMGDYPKAIEYHQQSLKIAREIKSRQVESNALGNLGLAYYGLGDYPKAIEYHQQSLKIAREIKSRQVEGNALNNFGNAYDSMGDYPKAIEYYQQSLKIAREIKSREGEGNALNNLGLTYSRLGDYPKAIDYHQQSLKIAQEIKDRKGEGQSLGALGNIYLSMGDYPKAIEYHQQSLKIAQEIKDREGEGNALGNLGSVYSGLRDDPKAIDYHQQSLKIAREIKSPQGEHISLGNLGLAYSGLGDYPQAIEYYQQSLKIAREIKSPQGEGISLGNLGNAYFSLGDYPQAIEYHQQFLKIAQEIKYREGEGYALNNLGLTYQKIGNLQLAESTLQEGIKVLEPLRGGLKDNNKITIFEQQSRAYRTLQQVLIAQNKTDAALEIAERGRARAFVELLASKLSDNPNEQLSAPPNIDQIKQIAFAQNATLVQYSIIPDDFKIEGKEQWLESQLYIWVIKPTGEVTFRKFDLKPLWQKQNTSLENTIAETLISLGSNINTRSSSSSFEVGDLVKPNGAFDRDPPWKVVAVDRQNQTVKIQLTPGNEQNRKFTEVTKVSYAYAANKKLQQLHKILIEPIADSLPKNDRDRVIFIPQGSLFFVPFPALQDDNRNYLIDKYTIQTSPSIQVLDLTRKQRQKLSPTPQNSPKSVLVVGNPIMPEVPPYLGKPPTKLRSLPYAEEEAKQVAQMFDTKAIIGNQATKSAILPLLPKARIIHLATHGLLDDFKNGYIPGAIALAPEPLNKGKSEGINGWLTSSEIFDLQLNNTELVVLSACDTGRGKITGDGVIGLSRSWISAGVPSVVVSLWSVDDDATKFLMGEFYQQLKNNSDKASALRDAMLATRRKNPEPKYWAAFTLIGETN
ncbi:CHAT domain-containing protein [Calothrix parietina]|nr:CHAT domain-containing tetratricopeptide repeat protein [Calothrix parietina]